MLPRFTRETVYHHNHPDFKETITSYPNAGDSLKILKEAGISFYGILIATGDLDIHPKELEVLTKDLQFPPIIEIAGGGIISQEAAKQFAGEPEGTKHIICTGGYFGSCMNTVVNSIHANIPEDEYWGTHNFHFIKSLTARGSRIKMGEGNDYVTKYYRYQSRSLARIFHDGVELKLDKITRKGLTPINFFIWTTPNDLAKYLQES